MKRMGVVEGRPVERIVRPFQRFADRSSSGGIVLIAAAVVALAWANSPWGGSYFALWDTKLTIGVGHLSSFRDAALPVVAALGGAVVPALIYLAQNAGTPGAAGWGIPMASDIAFALGVLTLLGERAPVGLKCS
jgi:NhaA family Na+:H+ antiporter